jgi:predicted nuclease with RNAse H fold
MRTVGVDLAADPANTGMCIVDWEAGTVALAPRPVLDGDIVTAVLGCDMAGFDVPLGWPDEFIDALVAHRAQQGWPPSATVPPVDRVPLRFRRTDLVTIASGSRPLSVSTDRIGVAAMRGARIQAALVRARVAVDRSGLSGRIAETYPAGALRMWGMQSTGYKKAANAVARAALVDAVVRQCGTLGAASGKCLQGCSDDDLDAFVCAVLAKAVRLRLTTGPSPEDADAARREGWIHLPTAPLDVIVAQPG